MAMAMVMVIIQVMVQEKAMVQEKVMVKESLVWALVLILKWKATLITVVIIVGTIAVIIVGTIVAIITTVITAIMVITVPLALTMHHRQDLIIQPHRVKDINLILPRQHHQHNAHLSNNNLKVSKVE